MFSLVERNAHSIFPRLLQMIKSYGVESPSRNGPVLTLDSPCCLTYEAPVERLVFWAERDCNPYFHFMEALWMMAGRNDVAFPAKYVSTMRNFSDNGRTFNAAYGHRWINHFGINQLVTIADALRANPDCRRQVMAMWDGWQDLGLDSKDIPCNTTVMFRIRDQKWLDITVTNRSNDAVWGAVGANVFHFSFMQEVMAAMIGVGVGRYHQFSNNMHLYTEVHSGLLETLTDPGLVIAAHDPYRTDVKAPLPIVNGPWEIWFQDLLIFMDEGPIIGFRDRFFRRVVTPLYQSWEAYNNRENPGRFDAAREILSQCSDEPLRLACHEWLNRKEDMARRKANA